MPQAPAGASKLLVLVEPVFTANTDNSFCKSAPWHAGHDGSWVPRVRYSK
jgi:hypothetical protein